ncbi:septum site-determining protein MinC [Aminobacter aminovorans]|uniref:Probable septum site-determining protein MinC n=1 Tax=Aminobacter aminovorans TaxID=83263 RepID=A0A380WN55_AMIAI|nr:septum site-determining protein MinC [Aminobacter aminovorans]TCS26044.1 septum site-determining protein MinC [Aminobacter aminovorans]SUU90291.1 Septum site-determining protein MinC [Aminobacter aminovorans]
MQNKSIRFRARSFVAFALVPEAPLEQWLQDLDRWIENSPGFFKGRPVVLDLNVLKPQAGEIGALVALIAERGIRTYAIEADYVDSLGDELPPKLAGARKTMIEEEQADAEALAKAEQPAEPSLSKTLIVEQPVRSGQSIVHPHGDVIVMGSASFGSEILAGGSIHVYGTLRGRAFAGAWGDRSARIFCRRNEAELLAVDGWYRTAEDMEPSMRGKAIQVHLDDNAIQVAPLN